MNCTNCKSDNTQKLEVVFENGTNHINTKSKTVGTSLFNPIGGLMGAKTSTKGVSMSSAATKAAPPTMKGFRASVILILIGAIWTYMNTLNSFDFIGAIIGIAVISGGVFLGYKRNQYNKDTFPPLYNAWLNSWMCNKCGTIFSTE
jgi:hypothetical protein